MRSVSISSFIHDEVAKICFTVFTCCLAQTMLNKGGHKCYKLQRMMSRIEDRIRISNILLFMILNYPQFMSPPFTLNESNTMQIILSSLLIIDPAKEVACQIVFPFHFSHTTIIIYPAFVNPSPLASPYLSINLMNLSHSSGLCITNTLSIL